MTNGLKNFLCFFSGLKDEKESLKKDLTEFKNNTEESLKHLEEITEEHNQDLDKLENDLKMFFGPMIHIDLDHNVYFCFVFISIH